MTPREDRILKGTVERMMCAVEVAKEACAPNLFIGTAETVEGAIHELDGQAQFELGRLFAMYALLTIATRKFEQVARLNTMNEVLEFAADLSKEMALEGKPRIIIAPR